MPNIRLVIAFLLASMINTVCTAANTKESYQLIGQFIAESQGTGWPILDISMSPSGKRLIVNYTVRDYFNIVAPNNNENNIVLKQFPYRWGQWHKTGYPIGMSKEGDPNYKFLSPAKEDLEAAAQVISDDTYFEDCNGNRLKTNGYLVPSENGSVRGLYALVGNKRISVSENDSQVIQRSYYDPLKKRILAQIHNNYVVYELKNGKRNKLPVFENNCEISFYPVKGEDLLIKRTAQLDSRGNNYIDMWLQVCDLKGNVVSNLTIFEKGVDPKSKDIWFVEATKEYLAVVLEDNMCKPDFRVKIFKRKIVKK